MSGDGQALMAFLVEAKRRTYAGLDDDATVAAPLLKGSKQLEYFAGAYAYRDIYFGMGFFVGQETVSKNDRAIWSMCYSGGADREITDRNAFLSIYKFLRQALSAVDAKLPYRGLPVFALDEMTYRNEPSGTFARFYGFEEISLRGSAVYELRYSGGLLR